MFQIYYLITNACNLHCTHCIRGSQEYLQYMSFDDAIKGLDKLSEWKKESMLILSGGEPTIHTDFKKILLHALKKFKVVLINTNGTTHAHEIFDRDLIRAKNLFIQVSLDGTEQYNDCIRGIGSYKVAIENIRSLLQDGFNVGISTTVNRRNVQSVLELCNTINDLRIFNWHVSAEMPIGRGTLVECLSAEEWNRFVGKMISKARVRLSIRKVFDFSKRKNLTEEQLEKLSKGCVHNCGTGSNKLYVNSNFNIAPCTCLDYYCGNLLNESVESIYNSEVMRKLRNFRPKENVVCYNCKYKQICNGGCFGISKSIFGEIGFGDIRCKIVRDFYEESKGILF